MSNPPSLGTLDLRRATLFDALNDEEVEQVSAVVEYRRCPVDTCIVESGSAERSLFVIFSGSVRIIKRQADGTETPIAEVLPGESLGEVTFVEGGARTATAITNEPTELLMLEPKRFRKLADEHPAIAYKIAWALLRLVCRRMRNTDFWLFELMGSGQPATELAPT